MRRVGIALGLGVCGLGSLLGWGCLGAPDPRTVKGAIAYAGEALAAGDEERLFKVIDPRSRHAMASIVADRNRARALVEANYPADVREAALRALGDAATVRTPEALFALRCDEACLDDFRTRIGAPASQSTQDGVVVVRTTRGTELRLYRKRAGDWYGFVHETEALVRERDDANRDLDVIRENARIYARRASLNAPR